MRFHSVRQCVLDVFVFLCFNADAICFILFIASFTFVCMKRIPEPELMISADQVAAYAGANFSESDQSFVDHLAEHILHQDDFLLPGSIVLDLGCGPGNIAERLAPLCPLSDVIGIDGASTMIDVAIERMKSLPVLAHNLRYVLADLKNIDFDCVGISKGASLIVSNSVLHHLHDPQHLWLAVKKLAQPGAFMLHRDLRRPANEQEVEALCHRYVNNAPPVLKRDYRASLKAAFRADEVREQLHATGLRDLNVVELGDRYLEVFGWWFP